MRCFQLFCVCPVGYVVVYGMAKNLFCHLSFALTLNMVKCCDSSEAGAGEYILSSESYFGPEAKLCKVLLLQHCVVVDILDYTSSET